MKMPLLSKKEQEIIISKGTESPFSGQCNDFFENGIYLCRQCGVPLYDSESKF